MQLETLTLTNFRNLIEQEIVFEKDLNIIYGDNAQGKTSILEAVHFLSIPRSFRTNSDKIALQHSKEHFEIKGNYKNSENQKTTIRLYYSIKDGKNIFVNNNKIEKFSELIGIIPVILLSLEDLELTYGYPGNRRKFADILLSQVSPLYLSALQNYKQTLLQRNKLLNLISEKKESKSSIFPWDKQLVKYGTEITKYREEFVQFIDERLAHHYHLISESKDIINAIYKSGISTQIENFESNSIKSEFEANLERNYNTDLIKQSTTIGPHRDDIEFLINGQLLKAFGSQGENKTFLIALKFIEGEYLKNKLKNDPIFLMDDIFGELDKKRIEHLTEQILKIGQTFITTTLKDKFSNLKRNEINYLNVSHGKVL